MPSTQVLLMRVSGLKGFGMESVAGNPALTPDFVSGEVSNFTT